MIANLFPGMSLQTEMDREDRLLKDLKNNVYQLVVTHESPSGSQFFCKECGTESLLFGLPKDHKYAQWESLSFSEMNGENMLLMPSGISSKTGCQTPAFSPRAIVSASTN